MAGVGWQSSDLLSLFNEWTQRPPTNDVMTDAEKYNRLSQGQDQVILECANLMGRILNSPPTIMTTTDGGYTYQYGVDGNGYPLFPLAGKIFPTLNAVPNYPWVPQRDYLDEGTQIRGMNGTPITVAPYFYGIWQPAKLSASVQPIIEPTPSRVLLVIQAAKRYAEEGNRDRDLAATMAARWDEDWKRWATAIRKHLRGPRQLGPITSGYGNWTVAASAAGLAGSNN